MFSNRTLRLSDSTGEVAFDIQCVQPGIISDRDAWRLLAAVLTQARSDGMTQVELEAIPAKQALTMRYFGPGSGTPASWWEMSPPPIEAFAPILRVMLQRAELDGGLPVRGRLRARIGRKPFVVRFELGDLHRVLIKW